MPTSKADGTESPKGYSGNTMGMPLAPGVQGFLPVVGNNPERTSILLDHYEDLQEDVPLALAQEYQMKGCLKFFKLPIFHLKSKH